MLKFVKTNLFFLLLLTAVVFSLYGKSIKFDFTYRDDSVLILEKANFLSDIKNVPKLFVTSCFYSNDFQYYRPILNLVFLTETVFFGVNPEVYHFINIILLILALYLMYVFLCDLNLNKIILKFVVLLTAVHPILTSCAVWIPARNDTLLAIFIFLSFIFFIKYLEYNLTKNLVLYILFFTLALFTKETAILTLLLYPLFVYCFNYKINKKEIIKNVVIFVPVLLIYFVLRCVSVSDNNVTHYLTNFVPFFKNMFVGTCVYLCELFIPDNFSVMLYEIKLNVFYISALIVSIVFVVLSVNKKIISKKAMLFFLCWFILFLLPTFLLLQDYVFFNHRIIVSLVSFIFIFTVIAEYVVNKNSIFKNILIVLFGLLFIANSYFCFIQQNKYENRQEYWTNTYSDAPTYHGACYWLGRLSFEKGKFRTAKDLFIKANDLKPVYLCDLALIYYYEGNFNKSEELYNKSLESGINKAQCYRNLSTIYLRRDNDKNKAIEYAKLAVQEEPYDDRYKEYLQKLTNEENSL